LPSDGLSLSKTPYKTLRGEGAAEYEEKRSRFIGEARPAACEGDALAFLEEVRRRHKDVSHNVYAYLCGEGGLCKRYSDGGEPRGTAGVPVLDVIEKAGLRDAVIVVTRYFGGILLGAAGLIRSYGKAASLAVNAAGVVIKTPAYLMSVLVGYAAYDSVRNMLDKGGFSVTRADFGADIEMNVIVPYDEAGALRARVTELTAGAAVIECIDDIFIDASAQF